MAKCIRAFAPAALILLLMACSLREGPRSTGPSTRLVVRNESVLQMRIYAVTGSQRVRLGIVSGNHRDTLEIPDYLVSGGRELRFLAEPLAGSNVEVSFTHFVQPGETIEIRIPSMVR